MSETRPQLAIMHLVSGAYDLEKDEIPLGSLEPIANRFLVLVDKKVLSLLTTDERGRLVAVDSQLQSKPPLRRLEGQPLTVDLVPHGLVLRAHAGFGANWQAKLLGEIRALGIGAALTTIPVPFMRKHLRAPRSDEEKAAFGGFEDGKTYSGQMIVKTRCLIVLIEAALLDSVPSQLTARVGEKELTLSLSRTKLHVVVEGAKSPAFVAYSMAGRDLPEDRYVVRVPGGAVINKRNGGRRQILRTFEVAFSSRSIFCDIDVHVFELPSVESALLLHFGTLYPHLLAEPDPANPVPTYAIASNVTARARAIAQIADAKQKMVMGWLPLDAFSPDLEKPGAAPPPGLSARSMTAFIDAKTKGTIRDKLLDLALEAAESGLQVPIEDPSFVVSRTGQAASAALKAYKTTRDISTKWTTLRRQLAAATMEKSVATTATAASLDKLPLKTLFRASTLRTAIERELQNANGPVMSRLKSAILKVDGSPEFLKRLARYEAPVEMHLVDQRFGKLTKGVLTTLSVAVTIDRMVQAIFAMGEAITSEEVERGRLLEGTGAYWKTYADAPATAAFRVLETMRLRADGAADVRDAADNAFRVEVETLVDIGVSLIPVVGQIAALVDIGQDLGMMAIEHISRAVDHLWRHRSAGTRLLELSDVHALQVRSMPDGLNMVASDEAHVQWRVRVVALVGLLRLIERLGSPHADPEGFKAKVIQYGIQRYIETFLLRRDPFVICLFPGTPLDELWLYAMGHDAKDWNESLASFLRPSTWAWRQMDNGARMVRWSFRQLYPIEGLDAPDVHTLARAFSRNFSGVIDGQLAFAAVYVRKKDGDPWVRAGTPGFTVTPRTLVRIVGVFRRPQGHGDLSGVPVSLQLVRTDGFTKDEGPVYKSTLARARACLTDESGKPLDDKNLLNNAEEGRFIGDKDAYCCVFYPFYFFRGQLQPGLKPFGHIPLARDPHMDLAFQLRTGDDGVWITRNGGPKGAREEVAVHMDLSNGTDVEMLCDRPFLAKKTHVKLLPNIFGKPYQEVKAEAVYFKAGAKKWKKGIPELRLLGPEFWKPGDVPIQWGQPLELALVFSARFIFTPDFSNPHFELPAHVKTWNVFRFSDDPGPEYPSQIVCVHRTPVAHVSAKEAFSRLSLTDGPEDVLGLPELRAVFAVHVRFTFSVQSLDGREMKVVQGLKPFGESPKVASENEVRLDLLAPAEVGLGQHLAAFARISVGGDPMSVLKGTTFAGDQRFITDEKYRLLLQVEKVPSFRTK